MIEEKELVDKLVEESGGLVVDSEKSFIYAAQVMRQLRTAEDAIGKSKAAISTPLYRKAKEKTAPHKQLLKDISGAMADMAGKLRDWKADQDRKKFEADKLARKAQAEEQRKVKREFTTRAKTLDKEGRTEEAVELRESVPFVPMEETVVNIPHVEGVKVLTRWVGIVDEPWKLPPQYLQPDPAAIQATVDRQGPATKIPGVRVVQETDVKATKL
jgi:hypothetical protein